MAAIANRSPWFTSPLSAPAVQRRPRSLCCRAQLSESCSDVQLGRREALVAVALAIAAAPAWADEPSSVATSSSAEQQQQAPPEPVDPSSWPSYIDFAFQFKHPPTLMVVDDLTRPDVMTPPPSTALGSESGLCCCWPQLLELLLGPVAAGSQCLQLLPVAGTCAPTAPARCCPALLSFSV